MGVFKAPLLALAVFVAVASANYGWTPGQEYHYLVNQRLVSGQPELKHQYAGQQLKFKVIVQATQQDTLLIKAHDFDQAELNEVVSEEWWNTKFQNQKPLHAEIRSMLETPFLVQIQNGKAQSIKVDQAEPEFVLNFKKSIVSSLNVDTQAIAPVAAAHFAKDQVNNIYKTVERTVSGECQVVYERHQVPRAVRKEHLDEVTPIPELCQNSPVWEVTKTTNFSRCNENNKPSFNTLTPDGQNAHHGLHALFQHALTNRYTICGGERSGLIQTIVGDETITVQPMGYKTEKLYGESFITFSLRNVQQIKSHLQVPRNGKTVNNIVFKFPNNKQQHGQRYGQQYGQQYGQEYNQEYNQQYNTEYNTEYDQEYNQDYEQQYGKQYGQQWNQKYQQEWTGEDRDMYNTQSADWTRSTPRLSSVGTWYNTIFGGRQEQDEDSTEYEHESRLAKKPTHPQQRYPFPALTHPLAFVNPRHVSVEQLMQQVPRLTKGIAHDLHSSAAQLTQTKVLDKVETLAKKLEYLNLQQLVQVYKRIVLTSGEHSKLQQTEKQIFLDCVAMAGTNPSVMFIKQLIEKHQLKGEQAAQIVATLPKYVKTPTKQLLEQIFELLRSPSVQSHKQLKTTLVLAFTQLVHEAYIKPATKNTKYPTNIFGTFGHPESSEITQKYIPYLVQKLEQAQSTFTQSVYIKALGNMGHKDVFPVLKKIVQGKIETSDYVRAQACIALYNLLEPTSYYVIKAQHGQEQAKQLVKSVKQLLVATTLNPSVNYKIRLSAFTVLMDSNIELVYLQKIALRTWFDPSMQYVSFVRSVLKNVAEEKSDLNIPEIHETIEKCRKVFPMTKPVNSGLLYSYWRVASHEIKQLRLGFISEMISIGSQKSIFPEQFRYNLMSKFGGFNYMPISLHLNAFNVKDVTKTLFSQSPFFPLSHSENQQYDQILDQIKQQLNVESRKNMKQLDGSLFVRFSDEVQRMFPVNHQTLQQIMSHFTEEHSRLENGMPINYQKAMKLADLTLAVPTQAGIPFVVKLKVPAVVSLQGHVKVETHSTAGHSAFPEKIKLVLDVSPLYTWKIIASAGYHRYTTMKTYATGFEKEFSFHLPGAIVVKADLKHKEFSLKHVLPEQQQVAGSSQVEIVTYKVKPFTAIAKTHKIQAITFAEDFKTIKTVHQLNKKTHEFGHRTTGLNLVLEQTSETDLETVGDLFKKVAKEGLETVLYYPFSSSTLRYRKYKLILDLAQSQTKEVQFTLNYDEATKAALIKHTPATGSQRYGAEYDQEYRSGKPFFAGERTTGYEHGQTKYESNTPTTANVANKQTRSHLINRVFQQIESGKVQTLDVAMIFKGQQRRQYSATLAVASDASKITKKVKIVLERTPATTEDQRAHKVYVSLEAKFPSIPEVGLEQVLNADVTTLVKAKINFGQSIEQPEGQIKIEGVMKQNEEVQEYLNTLHKTKQCKKHMQHGFELHPTCVNATRLAAILNEYHFNVQYHQVPQSIKQTLYSVENFLKAAYYPEMVDKKVGVQHEQGHIKVDIKVHPIRHHFDVKIQKPTETLIFNKVHLGSKVETVFPINAKRSIAQRVYSKLIGGTQATRCSIHQDKVVTFDNVMYETELSNCYHVLTKDCSGQYKFAVLAKQQQSSSEKIVKIIAQNTNIKIVPQQSAGRQFSRSAGFRIMINNREEVIPVNQVTKVVENGITMIKITPKINGVVVVKAPVHGFEVRTDGHFVITKMLSTVHRSNLCGLCGDFNGETTADLKTPKKCIESPEQPQRFVRSYALQDGHCNAASPRDSYKHQQAGIASTLVSVFRPNYWTRAEEGKPVHHQTEGKCIHEEEYFKQHQQQLIGSGSHDFARFQERYQDEEEFTSELFDQIQKYGQQYDSEYETEETEGLQGLRQKFHQVKRVCQETGACKEQLREQLEEVEQQLRELVREKHQAQRAGQQARFEAENEQQVTRIAHKLNRIEEHLAQRGLYQPRYQREQEWTSNQWENEDSSVYSDEENELNTYFQRSQQFSGAFAQTQAYEQIKAIAHEFRQWVHKQLQRQTRGQSSRHAQEQVEYLVQLKEQLNQLRDQAAQQGETELVGKVHQLKESIKQWVRRLEGEQTDSAYESQDDTEEEYTQYRQQYQSYGSEEVQQEIAEIRQQMKHWENKQDQIQSRGQNQYQIRKQVQKLQHLKNKLQHLQAQAQGEQQQEQISEMRQTIRQWYNKVEQQLNGETDSVFESQDDAENEYTQYRQQYQSYGSEEVQQEIAEIRQQMRHWENKQDQIQSRGQNQYQTRKQVQKLQHLKNKLQHLQAQAQGEQQQEQISEMRQTIRQWWNKVEQQLNGESRYQSRFDDEEQQQQEGEQYWRQGQQQWNEDETPFGYRQQYGQDSDEETQQQGYFGQDKFDKYATFAGRQQYGQDSDETENVFSRHHQYNDEDQFAGRQSYDDEDQYTGRQSFADEDQYTGRQSFAGEDSTEQYQQQQDGSKWSWLSQRVAAVRPFVFGRY